MIKLLSPSAPAALGRSLLRYVPLRVQSFVATMTVGSLLAALPVHADTILRYDMTGQSGTQPMTPPTTVADGLSAEGIIRGAGITPYDLARGMSSDNYSTVPEGVDGRQQAIDEEEYYEFSFTVAPGYVASLEGLVHSLRRSAANGPMYYEWQYSFDGFASEGATIVPQGPIWDMLGWTESYFYYRGRNSGSGGIPDNYNYMVGDVAGQGEGNEMPTFVLSGIEDLQNIPGGTTVSFRLYAWGNASTAASNTVAFGRESATQIGGPLLSGSVIVDPDLGDQLPLQILSDFEGTDPAPGLHTYQAGSSVTATAPASIPGGSGVRHVPEGWTGTGSVSSGEGNSVTFTLNEASTLEWNWRQEHRLAVTADGDGVVEVTTTERRPLLGWDFAGYRMPPEEGELQPWETSNLEGVPTSTVASDMQPSVVRRTPVYDEDAGELGLRPADLAAGGLSASMWRHTPTLASAIARDKYFEFTVEPMPGETVSLDSLSFWYRYTATGPHSMALLYSLDDFETYTIIESLRFQDQNSGTQDQVQQTFLFPPEPELQNVTSKMTFRLYAWGGTGSGVGTLAFRNTLGAGFDDMVLYGGQKTITSIAGTQELWLDARSLFNIEAVAEPGNLFVGWSGSYSSNVTDLRGMDMRQPVTVTATFAADSDGDGLPDEWELQHFTNLDSGPNDDPDDDGFTNLEEYLRGTDPTHAEELLAAGDVPLSIWENPQRDPLLSGRMVIRDFGGGFRGVWEGSNHSRSAQDPFHPEGVHVNIVNNVSFDGPRLIIREDSWPEEWNDASVETVFSVGDDDGNTFFFRYQDELNWYRVSIAGEDADPNTRPLRGISIQRRINGVYSSISAPQTPYTDPNDVQGYKRMRVRFTPIMESGLPKIHIAVSGWEDSANSWQTSSFGHREYMIDDELGWGRAGFGTWAQGGAPDGTVHPDWNSVSHGTLFESFQITLDGNPVLVEDWASAPLPGDFPTGWQNPYTGVSGLAGNWRVSVHGSIAEITSQGEPTSGSAAGHAADADAPTLLAPSLDLTNYVLDIGIHPFNTGANGFVFDYVDENNFGRILFANTLPGFDGSIPSGVAVSRKQNGVWSDIMIGDTGFIYRPGQPFHVSFKRSGQNYVMTVRELDRPEPVRRWEWNDSTASSGGGRYGFTTWQSADVHFLFAEAYGAVASIVEGIAITGIEKIGEQIFLTVENPSGQPYDVQRTLDLSNGEWETVDTDQTGTTWSGPVPSGADKAFWRLAR